MVLWNQLQLCTDVFQDDCVVLWNQLQLCTDVFQDDCVMLWNLLQLCTDVFQDDCVVLWNQLQLCTDEDDCVSNCVLMCSRMIVWCYGIIFNCVLEVPG